MKAIAILRKDYLSGHSYRVGILLDRDIFQEGEEKWTTYKSVKEAKAHAKTFAEYHHVPVHPIILAEDFSRPVVTNTKPWVKK